MVYMYSVDNARTFVTYITILDAWCKLKLNLTSIHSNCSNQDSWCSANEAEYIKMVDSSYRALQKMFITQSLFGNVSIHVCMFVYLHIHSLYTLKGKQTIGCIYRYNPIQAKAESRQTHHFIINFNLPIHNPLLIWEVASGLRVRFKEAHDVWLQL